jgi:hypothetical protein
MKIGQVSKDEKGFYVKQIGKEEVSEVPQVRGTFTSWQHYNMVPLLEVIERIEPQMPNFVEQLIQAGIFRQRVRERLDKLTEEERFHLKQAK